MNLDLERFKIQRPGLIPVRLWNDLIDLVASALITSFVGGTVMRTIHGTNLYTRGGGDDAAILPFACTLVPQTNEDGSPNGNKVRVEYNSTLFKSLVPLEECSGITGLFDPDPTSTGYPIEFDLDDVSASWHDTSLTLWDIIVLEIKFHSDGTIDTVGIQTRGNGSTVDHTLPPWDTSLNSLLAMDSATAPTYQKYARIVLATYEDGVLTQVIDRNLLLLNMVFSGRGAIYPRIT